MTYDNANGATDSKPAIADIAELASWIDPELAQLTVAKIMRALGRKLDWGPDTLAEIARIMPSDIDGVPDFCGDQDYYVAEFWNYLPD